MTDVDPVDFVLDALAALPDDPAALSDEEMKTLAAVAEGSARHAVEVRARMGELARRLLGCGTADLSDAAQYAELCARGERARRADELLTPFFSAALAARGHDLDRMVEANTKTRPKEDER